MNIMKVLGGIMILLGLVLVGFGLYDLLSLDIQVEEIEVKCYDRWNNEIIGETCIEEKVDEIDELIFVLAPGSFLIIVGIFMIVVKVEV